MFDAEGRLRFYNAQTEKYNVINSTAKIKVSANSQNKAKEKVICINSFGNLQVINGNEHCSI